MVLLICPLIASASSDEVKITRNGNEVTIENENLARVYDVTDGQVTTRKIMNKRSGTVANVNDAVEFAVTFMDGKSKRSSDFKLQEISTSEDEDGTKTLKFDFSVSSDGWKAALFVSMKPGDHFLRKHLDISHNDSNPIAIDRIDLESLVVPGPYWSTKLSGYEGLGQPVYANDLFFGIEFPASDNKIINNNKINAGYNRGKYLNGNTTYTTYSSVVGAADSQKEIQQSFFDYINTISLPSQFRIQFNSWYDNMKNINTNNIKQSFMGIEKGLSSYGIRPIDAYVVDDGWVDYRNGFWEFDFNKFPQGFANEKQYLGSLGTNLGTWIGPRGSYDGANLIFVPHLQSLGYEAIDNADMSMSGPKYTKAMKERILEMMDKYDINYFKLDGFIYNGKIDKSPDHGFIPDNTGKYYFTDAWEKWIDIFKAMREKNPDVYINITSGTFNSPWFFQYVNAIWINNSGDMGLEGTGSERDRMLTYRDGRYYDRFVTKASQMQLSNIYNHEPIDAQTLPPTGNRPIIQTLEEFRKYMFMSLSRGTGLIELYYTPGIFNEEKWTINADALQWAEDNYGVLQRARMIGGNPSLGEVYGYSGWTADRGIVSLRNPSSTVKTFKLTLNSSIGVKDNEGSYYRQTVYPYGAKQDGPFPAETAIEVALQPYEVLIWQFDTEQDRTAPQVERVAAHGMNEIKVTFTERVDRSNAESVNHYRLTGNAEVRSAQLGEDYKTVTLTVSDLARGVPYSLTIDGIKDMAGVPMERSVQPFRRVDQGLTARWTFEEPPASGHIAADYTGNGSIGTVIGEAERAARPDGGQALRLNGEDSYVIAGESASVAGTGEMAVSAWMKTTAAASQVILSQRGEGTAAGEYVLELTGEGAVRWSTADGNHVGFQVESLARVNDGLWHHIAAVREANGMGKIYIDGGLDQSDYTGYRVNLSQAEVAIGADARNKDRFFHGELDDVRIYNRAISFDEAAQEGSPVADAANVALGKPVTASGPLKKGQAATDGIVDMNSYAEITDAGLQWIQIDLGQSYNIQKIKLWHYFGTWGTSRHYNDVIIQLSDDAQFSPGRVATVFNNDTDNSAGQGGGSDSIYVETAAGKEIVVPDIQARYVRLWTSGSTLLDGTPNLSSHYTEVEVYGAIDRTGIPVTGVSLDKTSITLQKDEAAELIAAITPAEATNKLVTWSSSDETVARVEWLDGAAHVIGIGSGTALITVTTADGGYTDSVVVNVIADSGEEQPAAMLIGKPAVVENETFTVQFGLQNITRQVMAQDITIRYDSGRFAFIDAESMLEGVSILTVASDKPGEIRLLIASKGIQHAISGEEVFLRLQFKALAGMEGSSVIGTIETADAILANELGSEFMARPARLDIIVNKDVKAIPEDLNGDGKVSIGDLALAAAHYGKSSESPDWEAAILADVNGDGQVDIADLALIAKRILQ